MELMDEWESNTNRRICWGSAGRYWVAGQLQEGGHGLPLGIFFQRGTCFSGGRKESFCGVFLRRVERRKQRRSFCLVVFSRGRKDSRGLLWRDFGHCTFSRGELRGKLLERVILRE